MAAALLGCDVAQIAKAPVFRRGAGRAGAVLVIANGGRFADVAL